MCTGNTMAVRLLGNLRIYLGEYGTFQREVDPGLDVGPRQVLSVFEGV